MLLNSKWILTDRERPDTWLNLASLIRKEYPIPVLGEGNIPANVGMLAQIYSEECARIEMLDGKYGSDPHISIPGEVMDLYRSYRATPLFRAVALEQRLGYGGRVFYKREDVNPTGSHKPNTAFPQAHYAKNECVKTLITDTGAGQWGAALALACYSVGLGCTVFMTRNSYCDKPYRRYLMQLAGALVYASPSEVTEHGRSLLRDRPDHWGSLGIGMGEAFELVSKTPGSKLALGCMSYYAALHQTVVGQELSLQLDRADCKPDVLIACVGGGTNLFGFMATFLKSALMGESYPQMIAAESASVPVLTRGQYRYDYADYFQLTPKVLMYTLGHDFVPPKVHSGGLRYHGKSPILSMMVRKGLVQAEAISQEAAFSAGRIFYETEGILAAPESCHAIAAVLNTVEKAKQAGHKRDIVFCLSGTGYLDLQGFASVFGFC
jgi:tryptophan synthase beta chain